MSDKRVCEVVDEAEKKSTKAKQSRKTGSASCAEAMPSTSATTTLDWTKPDNPENPPAEVFTAICIHTLDWTKPDKPDNPPAEVLPQSVSAQMSGILKLLYILNDRVGQLEDRDCSGTSAPLQSHHDDNDNSQSDSANRREQEASPAKSASDFPKFDLCEELELDDDEDVWEDDFANFFVSDDKTSQPIQDKLAESINAGLCLTAEKKNKKKTCYRKLFKSLKDQQTFQT